MEALGIDVGGVIIDSVKNDYTPTAFHGNRYLETTVVPGAFEAIAKLVSRFSGEVYIISQCGPHTQRKTLSWLAHHHFYEVTGFDRGKVLFCLNHSDKGIIAARVGLTHFIDDRLNVLRDMEETPHLYLFQPRIRELERYRSFISRVTIVNSWDEITHLLGSI